MKSILKNSYIFLASLFLLLVGCGEVMNNPEVITPNHSVIKISQSGNGNIINMNQHIDFADVSQGVESRQWIFPGDDTVTVEGNPEDVQVRGVFHMVGTYDVKLHQVFKGNAYVGTEETPRETNEIDTVITVTVMPKVELKSVKANILNTDGTLGDEIPLENVETPKDIPFGSVLRFTYQAEGNPTQIQGEFFGAELLAQNAEMGTFDVKYVTLDKVYSIAPVFLRPQPMSSDTLAVVDFVKCVRSDEPLTLEEVASNASQKPTIKFSRGLNANSLNKEDFSVVIQTAKGATINPEIVDAFLDPDDASKVILDLGTEVIYNDDMVTVSFTEGRLESADAARATSFTDEELEVYSLNLLKEGGFDYDMEDASVNWNAGQPDWLGGDFTNTLEKTSEHVTSGSKSLKISVNPYNGVGAWGNGTVVSPFSNGELHRFPYSPHPDAGNKVKISFDLYLEENSGNIDPSVPNQFATNIRMYINWGAGGAEKAHSIGGLPEGQWYHMEDVLDITNVLESFSMAIKIAQTGDKNCTVHIDNINVSHYQRRP
ncbi:hypothetical protein KMW28_27635 [Flammeovirga yaeyamensis]|uniref:Uncharacterized protein n=1 Tax=Flammeovirga yaeyamensis TaxID=367791 RepID=A0AAX1NAS3_9BACT|nr:hypothetical protein [Flammeovirga yaeyamensis]MBB3699943.1 hypothetical protein [Flammeovirga yaeyamensis]NMF37618.1 hypothetical protein [Flammeovirga yaeyamensis]QWG04674.1 hypothetical protein KMW28_27635 [Flammeovirga yaeyamensis]